MVNKQEYQGIGGENRVGTGYYESGNITDTFNLKVEHLEGVIKEKEDKYDQRFKNIEERIKELQDVEKENQDRIFQWKTIIIGGIIGAILTQIVNFLKT